MTTNGKLSLKLNKWTVGAVEAFEDLRCLIFSNYRLLDRYFTCHKLFQD